MLTLITVVSLVGMFLYFVLRIGKREDEEEGEPRRLYIKTLERSLYVKPHAVQRIVERGISFESLERMLESPESAAVVQKNGRIRVTDGKITAVLEPDGDDLLLVTTFRNGRSRNR